MLSGEPHPALHGFLCEYTGRLVTDPSTRANVVEFPEASMGGMKTGRSCGEREGLTVWVGRGHRLLSRSL